MRDERSASGVGAIELAAIGAGMRMPPIVTHDAITVADDELAGVGACRRLRRCCSGWPSPHVRALLLNNAILFVSEASRGIVLATQFSYISSVTGGGDAARAAASAAVALFSVGRLVANVGMGWAADRWPVRSVLVAALVIHALGQVLYAVAGHVSGVGAILAARLMIGFGSGTLGVNRSFAASMAPAEERTRQFSILGTSKFVGYALTPFLGQIIIIGDASASVPNVSSFGSSGLLMAAAAAALAVAAFALLPAVSESGRGGDGGGGGDANRSGGCRAARDAAVSWFASWTDLARLPARRGECLAAWSTPVAVAGIIFVVINLVSKGALTMVETIMSADFQLAFRDDDGDLIIDTEEYVTVLGLGGLVLYVFMIAKPNNRRSGATVNGRAADSSAGEEPLGSAAAASAGEVSCGSRVWQSMGPAADPWLLIGSLALTGFGAALASPAPNGGHFATMTTGFVLIWSVGAPVADILAASMYSVIVSEVGGKHGTAMGAITAAGSIGRIIFPLVFGVVSHAGTLWLAAGACSLCAGIAWVYFHRYSNGLYWCCRRASAVDGWSADDAGRGAASDSVRCCATGAPKATAQAASRGRSAVIVVGGSDDNAAVTTALLHPSELPGRS